MKRQKSIFDQIPNQFFFFFLVLQIFYKIKSYKNLFFTCWSLQTHNVSFSTYGIENVVLISLWLTVFLEDKKSIIQIDVKKWVLLHAGLIHPKNCKYFFRTISNQIFYKNELERLSLWKSKLQYTYLKAVLRKIFGKNNE